jgi:hypothetical protein
MGLCGCRWILTDQLTLNAMWREKKILVESVNPQQVRTSYQQTQSPWECRSRLHSTGELCGETDQLPSFFYMCACGHLRQTPCAWLDEYVC